MRQGERKILYILHEYGAPGHYEGLQHYCNIHSIQVSCHEFSWIRQLLSGIKHFSPGKVARAVRNALFLAQLAFTRDAVIVLGMAPYDYRMLLIRNFARRHRVCYHTSWNVWDGSIFPKKRFYRMLKRPVLAAWKDFLEVQAKGICCVSGRAAEQLSANYTITCPVSTVYHAVDGRVFFPDTSAAIRRPLRLLFAGRILREKGIPEILRLAAALPPEKFVIGIAGAGGLTGDVQQAAGMHRHIIYHGQLSRTALGDLYRSYDVLLFPSRKRPGGFEELFGISLIEGMACGLIPLATDHTGPREIIDHGVNGYLLREAHIDEDLLHYVRHLADAGTERMNALSAAAIKTGGRYYLADIARRWGKILDTYYA